MERRIRKRIFVADAVDADPITLGRNDAPPADMESVVAFANTAGHERTIHGHVSSNPLLWAGKSAVDRRL